MKSGVLLGAGAGLGLLLLWMAGGAPQPRNESLQKSQRITLMELAQRVVDYVARGESGGRYHAQNRNGDNQGLSFGILQWAQRPGSLGKLLGRMRNRDRVAFDRIFGGNAVAAELVAMTNAAAEVDRLAPVGGVLLWNEPWTTRFTAAGKYGPFQEVQRELATTGELFKTALQVVALLGVRTERAHILAFDRANHGPVLAIRIANALVALYNREGWPPPDRILADYAAAWASTFFSPSKPASGDWRLVDGAYHKFTGNADLYAIVLRRTSEILADPNLSDAPLQVVA